MSNPFYTLLGLIACGYLATSNMRGWSVLQTSANRAAAQSTAYRYRPAFYSSSSGGGFFSGFGHK